jgi:2-keto-4-pentenoate hydratase
MVCVMTASSVIDEIASRLCAAEADRRPTEPVTARSPDLTVEDGYAVQSHNVARRVAEGRSVRGHKVGLTSAAMQDLLGVREPTFGVLLDDMFVDDGDEVALDTLIEPRVEAEIAVVMADDLPGPGATVADALRAADALLPAIEIVDSRIAHWQVGLVDTIADNASSGRVVLGGRLTPVTEVDLRLLGILFRRNGVPIDSGAGAAAWGNPARCVAWLANTLAGFGSCLRRGEVVLTGALHRMVPVRPHDTFRADFAHLGSVTVRFGGAGERP